MTDPVQAPDAPLAPNPSFSEQLPGLQLGIDSTSLGAFKTCPRFYQLSIVEGWEPRQQSVHLAFGLWVHGARELYEHKRQQGLDHDAALCEVMLWVMLETWDSALGRGWASGHKLKNRLTLVRSVCWYLDEFGANDPLETVVLANGRPAVELSFKFDSGFAFSNGERVTFCGHLDRVATLGGEPFIQDIKTTGSTLSGYFFDQFTPGNQFSMYALAGRVAFGVPAKGIIVDGMQVAVEFTRCQRGLVTRTEAQLTEWLSDSYAWLRQMENAAIAQHWPQNDKSCGLYGGCQFKEVCSRNPSARPALLRSQFRRRVWSPMTSRGDV
jgi:hypothetical protein